MDSITHLALGACIGAACAPRAWRKRGALIGAMLNFAPDLDVLAVGLLDDPVMRLSYHRAATHSLLVLPFVALALWLALRRFWWPVRESPGRWLLLCLCALVSHPLLDAFSVYGTQLLWPLDSPPVMLASLFIVDPLFSLPLLIGAGVAIFARDARRIAWWARMGIAFAGVYLAWTQVAQLNIRTAVQSDLEAHQLVDAKLLVQPAPLQSLLWRVLVLRKDGTYFEGYYSYLSGEPLDMDNHPTSPELLVPIENSRDVERLKWFTRGFYAVDADGDHVVLTDLRMGSSPNFAFRYIVGDTKDGVTVAREPAELLPWPRATREEIGKVWRKLFDPKA